MAKRKPTPENKSIARYAAAAFGGKPRVDEYLHDTLPLAIDILSCPDRPDARITAYSSVGLSDYPMRNDDGSEFPTRLEISGACASTETSYPNILAAASFNVMRTSRLVYPGAVMTDYVSEFCPWATVPHLYFGPPFLWEASLKTLDCGMKRVSWLLAVPISSRELDYLRANGDENLEALLEAQEIDMYDLRRPSAL